MRILLTGARGQVGWELRRTLMVLGEVHAPDSSQLDLRSAQQLREAVRALKPDLIVNPAAYTAVDRAESEVELAMAVNGLAPGVLAEEAVTLGIPLIHFSTDYVFDGTRVGAYREDDEPAPLNIYGRSKLAGEQAVRSVGGKHLILRTSWVYGPRGANFFITMNRLLRDRVELNIVADQVGAPTSARLIAEATAQLVGRLMNDPAAVSGTFHLTSSGSCSWFEFAQAIAEGIRNREPDTPLARLHPIPASDYPAPARRPSNSRLDLGRLETMFGLSMPDWRTVLALVQDEYGLLR